MDGKSFVVLMKNGKNIGRTIQKTNFANEKIYFCFKNMKEIKNITKGEIGTKYRLPLKVPGFARKYNSEI